MPECDMCIAMQLATSRSLNARSPVSSIVIQGELLAWSDHLLHPLFVLFMQVNFSASPSLSHSTAQ